MKRRLILNNINNGGVKDYLIIEPIDNGKILPQFSECIYGYGNNKNINVGDYTSSKLFSTSAHLTAWYNNKSYIPVVIQECKPRNDIFELDYIVFGKFILKRSDTPFKDTKGNSKFRNVAEKPGVYEDFYYNYGGHFCPNRQDCNFNNIGDSCTYNGGFAPTYTVLCAASKSRLRDDGVHEGDFYIYHVYRLLSSNEINEINKIIEKTDFF